MKRLAGIGACAPALLVWACATAPGAASAPASASPTPSAVAAPSAPAADVQAGRAALLKIDSDFSAAAQERGLAEAFAAYAAPDATMMPVNQNPVTGPAEVRKQFVDVPPGTTMVWEPFQADIAKSGDLGYTLGTYELHSTGPDGQPVTRFGKYCSVWKKQADGNWKWVVDIGNPSPPPR